MYLFNKITRKAVEFWCGSAGAAHTVGDMALSSYTGDISFTTGGVAVAIASGVNRIGLTNTSTANFGRVAFGESSAEAITNAATGKRLMPAVAANTNSSSMVVRIPPNATHLAIVADTATILVDVQQGS